MKHRLKRLAQECVIWGVGAPLYYVMVGQELGSKWAWRVAAPRWAESWVAYAIGMLAEFVWMWVYWSALWSILVVLPILGLRYLIDG
jgi:hypothetical protein